MVSVCQGYRPFRADIKTNFDAAAINIMRPKPKKTQKSGARADAARSNRETHI
jgi:hypothetical protein